MAVYFLYIKTFGRSTGSSAPGAAAYRAGERIRDERTGRTYDHRSRDDVMHKEIVLPSRLSEEEMPWARDRASLWNCAESAERRSNARVAREFLIALPAELPEPARLGLAREFSSELADRYGFVLDLTLHAPRKLPGSDARNYHAHLLATTREAHLEGLGAKTTLEMNDADRRQRGLEPAIHELTFARERWANIANRALAQANLAARIDHRSLRAQGIDREPRPQIPRVAFEMERQGYYSELAERIRREHAQRVQARLEKAQTPQHTGTRQPLEEIRRQAREDWLRLRHAPQAPARPGEQASVALPERSDELFK